MFSHALPEAKDVLAQLDEIVGVRDRRIAELEAALRVIASPTYGTEINDTDADRADCYWSHLQRFQTIARKALGS